MKDFAKIAGVAYIAVIIAGLGSAAIRENIIFLDDPAQTLKTLRANVFLFRIGIVADLIMVICDILVGWALFFLFKSVNSKISALAAMFRLAQATVIGLNLLNLFNMILLAETPSISADLASGVVFFAHAHELGYLISGLFFSFSCFAIAYLLVKSKDFSTIIGMMIGVGAVGYFVDCMVNFLFPDYAHFSEIVLLVTAVAAELAFAVALLLKGFKKPEATTLMS